VTEEQEAIAQAARDLLGEALLSASVDAGGALVLEVRAERTLDLLEMLRAAVQPPASRLADLHGIDDGQALAVVYHLFRPGEAFEVTVKAVTPRQRPRVPSVMRFWKGAWWPEREVMEMYGIEVVGHPDPRKLLLPDDWQGYPLRKDYVYPLDHPYLQPNPIHENPFVAGGGQGADTES